MKLVIVTGMSGAGKTVALKMLEDMGYYCVDNLPIPLMEKFAQLVLDSQGKSSQVALGIDIRSGEDLSMLDGILDSWKAEAVPFEILFLDAGDQVLIKRYKETRRSHPLSGSGRVDQGIRREREKLAFLKRQAGIIIDTSKLLTKELRQELEKIFMEDKSYGNLFVTVLSFGFKYGLPMEADLVFDVRCLPNPFYIPELKEHTGLDAPVRDYVMQFEQSRTLAGKLLELIDYQLPLFIEEGKGQLTVAVGCTGGKHRSVTFAELIYHHLQGKGYRAVVSHRDIAKRK